MLKEVDGRWKRGGDKRIDKELELRGAEQKHKAVQLGHLCLLEPVITELHQSLFL